jgi:hypothetical protein
MVLYELGITWNVKPLGSGNDFVRVLKDHMVTGQW